MATVVGDTLTDKIREEIAPGIRESLPAIDGVFDKIRSSSMGVVRDIGIGRDYYVKHNFTASLAGAFKWTSSPLGESTLTTVTPASVMSSQATFQGYDEMATMGIVQRRIQLNEALGNFVLPVEMFETDQMAASTFKYVGETIRQVAKLVAHLKAVQFYAVAPTGTMKPLAQVEAVDSGGSTGDAVVVISIIETTNVYNIGRIRNFYEGMFVNILSQANAWASSVPSGNYAVVTKVDRLNGTAEIKTTAAGTWDYTVAAQDVIIAKDCGATTVGYGTSGLETWMVDSGTVFNINVANYQQFKSMIVDVSGSLTESLMNKYIGSFMEAYGLSVDSVITPGGVAREMLDQIEDLGVFQRQGAALSAMFGWTDIGYKYQGKSLAWLLSTYCSPGRLYGCKLGEGNLTRYVPNKVPGTGTRSEFDGDVQFMAPWMGSSQIWKPLHSSAGASTKMVEVPFRMMEEICPRDIQGVKLTGLTELNA